MQHTTIVSDAPTPSLCQLEEAAPAWGSLSGLGSELPGVQGAWSELVRAAFTLWLTLPF